MRHAKLIQSFNTNTLKFIENWNSGHYNVKGFDLAEADIKELYLIKFFIDEYSIMKTNEDKIDSIIDDAEIILTNVRLTFDSYSKMIYLFRNYNLCIDSISKKFNIKHEKLLLEFKEKYKEKKKIKIKPFTFDIVNTPSFKVSAFGNNSQSLLE
jgi:hypothetical protein